MSEWKEVWYVWDGESEQPRNEVKVKLRSGKITSPRKVDWRKINHPTDIVAYTLGKMRRRVVCGGCGGVRNWATLVVPSRCQACNGTGKVWEYSE